MADLYIVDNRGSSGFSRKLCIKKIREELADNIELVRLFEAEARIVGHLHHDNIVQVYDFGRDEATQELFLVMELVDGLDLNSVLRLVGELGLQLPLDFAVYVLESLLLALDHAHTLRIDGEITPVIHRDISPHNLLVSTAGVVKLADFGIAKARGLSEATRTGVIKGKVSYIRQVAARFLSRRSPTCSAQGWCFGSASPASACSGRPWSTRFWPGY
jgi:serine/threonine protein kinase